MYIKKLPENHDCGISIANKVVGGKWNAWLLECVSKGIRRPTEIHQAMAEASPRVLNMILRDLTELGILRKTIYNEQPMRVEYFLTELGESILPVVEAMADWGEKNRDAILSTSISNGQ
jgi:DNA-binding HxlR family transcriptional regulator